MLKNRILAAWIIAFVIGVGIGLYTDGKIRIICFAAIGVLCGLSLAAHRFCSFNLKKVVAAGLLILFGMAYSAAYSVFVFSDSAQYNKKSDVITAEVKDIGCYAQGGYYDVSISESTLGVGIGTGIRLYFTGTLTDEKTGKPIPVRRGDTLSCTLTYKTHDSNRLYSKSIYLTAQGTVDCVATGDGFFYKLRKNTEKTIEELFSDYSGEVAAISKTLIVGETTDMDSYVYELFRNAGISHILVVSGLQISLIVMSLYGLLEFFTVHRKIRSILCLIILLAYAFFVGFSPSVSRAAIMTGIMLLSMLAIRRADSITSLFLALFVLLLVNPYNICSVGLQLSFLSCLGILILSPYLMRPVSGKAVKTKKLLKTITAPLIYTLAAAVFTFPVIFTAFDSVSYISPLTNLFITPVYTYLLIMLIPCILLFAVIGPGAVFLAFIPGKIIEVSYDLLNWLYEADIGSFSAYIPYMVLPLIFAVAAILALCFLRRRKMFVTVGAFMLSFIISISFCIYNFSVQSQDTVITALNDSYAYKSLFIADSDKCMYIDLGGKRSGISSVYQHGYCRLNAYVMNAVTEFDITKLKSALAEINIKTVYVPRPAAEEKALFDEIKVLAKSRNCDIIEFRTNITANCGRTAVSIKTNEDYSLSGCFTAVIRRSGKSIRVLSGVPVDHDSSLVYSDAVIITDSYKSDPYEGISCMSRCLKVTDEYTPPETVTGALYDFTDSSYVVVTIKNKAIGVSVDEP